MMSNASRGPAAAALRPDGYSLVELLVVTALTMVITAGVFTVMDPAQGTFRAQPEVADIQQRLRVSVDSIQKDLLMAGAGTYSGTMLGTLSNFFAPIMPYRRGYIDSDPPGTVRHDAITIVYIMPSAAQTTVRDPMPQPSAEIKVNAQPGCPAKDLLCGFKEGMMVVIFDDTGTWDPFTITHVQDNALHLQHRGQDFSKAYPAGSYIAQLASHTYYLERDAENETGRLRHYDGYQTDLPLVDDVVDLRFDYFGEPLPPMMRKPVSDPVGPWTTYGPKPPALGTQFSGSDYPPGENCIFDVDGGQHVPRLPSLTPGSNGLVELTDAMLTDGPFCPSSSSPASYDADLLRVRMVRVTIRLQSALKSLRGQGNLFFYPGTASRAETMVPDQRIQFDVTPRNLNLGR